MVPPRCRAMRCGSCCCCWAAAAAGATGVRPGAGGVSCLPHEPPTWRASSPSPALSGACPWWAPQSPASWRRRPCDIETAAGTHDERAGGHTRMRGNAALCHSAAPHAAAAVAGSPATAHRCCKPCRCCPCQPQQQPAHAPPSPPRCRLANAGFARRPTHRRGRVAAFGVTVTASASAAFRVDRGVFCRGAAGQAGRQGMSGAAWRDWRKAQRSTGGAGRGGGWEAGGLGAGRQGRGGGPPPFTNVLRIRMRARQARGEGRRKAGGVIGPRPNGHVRDGGWALTTALGVLAAAGLSVSNLGGCLCCLRGGRRGGVSEGGGRAAPCQTCPAL